jgi:hypothetical protein
MAEFEVVYRQWLEDISSGSRAVAESQKNLIDVLSRLRNVYTEAHLTDCSTGVCANPFILDRTNLGTEKGAE